MIRRNDITLVQRSTATRGSGEPGTVLDRYLGSSEGAAVATYWIPDEAERGGVLEVRLVDTSSLEPEIGASSARVHWHLLWARDESSAAVTLSSDRKERTWPIAPGDTVSVPAGFRLAARGGHLALAISVRSDEAIDVAPHPPSHGTDFFAGHNRRTTIPVPGPVSLSRWKLTQPLDVREHHKGDLLLVVLAGEPAVLTGTTVLAPRRGEVVFVPADTSPQVLPNGLTYLLVMAPA